MGLNRLEILGHVGQDPRITNFDDGGSVAQFSIAVTEKGYTSRDGRQVNDHTEWFNIVARNGIAKVVEQYVHKGDKVYLDGKVKTRQYTAQDGSTRSITEVIVANLELLGGKQGGQFAPPPQPATAAQPTSAQTETQNTDDLPF